MDDDYQCPDPIRSYKVSTKPKWIKCEDQYPQIRQNVLVYQTYPKGTMFNSAQYPLNRCFHLIAEYTKRGDQHVFWNREMVPFKHITHWMPLPDKPE